MKRSLYTFFLVASLSCPLLVHALLGTYKTAWGRRSPTPDRAITRLNDSHYTHLFTTRYGVTHADLDFLKQFITQLEAAKRTHKDVTMPAIEHAYAILKSMDVHGRLTGFTLKDAQQNVRKFEEIATRIILHHHR